MKKYSIILAFVLILMLAGCDGNEPVVPTLSPSPIATEPAKPKETKIEIGEPDPAVADWTILGEAEHDVSGDGNPDMITLRTSAIREEGELLLDDKQEWILSVETADGAYHLYRGNPHGTPYMEVSEFYVGDETIPVITLYLLTSADTQIRQYTWRAGAFYETVAYSAGEVADGGISRIYSSIPAYE